MQKLYSISQEEEARVAIGHVRVESTDFTLCQATLPAAADAVSCQATANSGKEQENLDDHDCPGSLRN